MPYNLNSACALSFLSPQRRLERDLRDKRGVIKELVAKVLDGTIFWTTQSDKATGPKLKEKARVHVETYTIARKSTRRVRVVLEKVVDYCIDYTVTAPSLWIITDHAWYKIAGHPCEAFPSPTYLPVFAVSLRRFQAMTSLYAVLSAMTTAQCKKTSFRAVLQKVEEKCASYPIHIRCLPLVDETFILKNSEFIKRQVGSLSKGESYHLIPFFP